MSLISFELSEIGIAANSGYALRDLWKKETLEKSSKTENLTFKVPPHGVVALRIKGKTNNKNPFKK